MKNQSRLKRAGALFAFWGGLLHAVAFAQATTAPASDASLKVQVSGASGAVLASQENPQKIDLVCVAPYKPGDMVKVTAPSGDKYLVVQIDDHIPQALVYAPNGQVIFTIPSKKLHEMYDPAAFKGASLHITARAATAEEITAYRNVALNSLDQRGFSEYFPHAIASSVTRDDPQFFERNAIDGNTQDTHHGKWPFESWGNGLNSDPWLKVDFGRDVTVDKVRLYVRSDFPHDTYWTNLTIQFSDGTTQDAMLKKTAEPQEIAFPAKKIRWLQLANFKQPSQPPGYAAITEVEVYGKDDAPTRP